MSNIFMLIVCTILGIGFINVSAHASSGDSTVTMGYAHFQFPGMKGFVKGATAHNKEAFNNFVNNKYFNSLGVYENATVRGYEGKDKNPQGINIKYRYEITDHFGVITTFTWTRSMTNSQTFIDVQPADHTRNIKNPAASARTDIRASYWSLLAGPSWRFNDYISVYAMAGMGVANVTTDLKINDNLNHGADSFSESSSTKKTSLAWAAGAQFNLNESVTLDVAYEGSGSGDWRTSGVTAGIGLKF
ncbi:Ail/Lom family outer membrane beta-barrel protein [Escherichia coli]|nr:Ail/Lom family outer membrane beta-barrel protein [Escherichia coli]